MANQKAILAYIDATFHQILSEIEKRPHGHPHITLRRIQSCNLSFGRSPDKPTWELRSQEVLYSWPGRSKEEAWRFACVLRILFQIRRAILSRVVVTKRDIYYHDPDLFKTQGVVDRIVEDIAHTCKVTRGELNVTASPKGLCAGLSGDDLMKTIDDTSSVVLSVAEHPNWILVVEKEATFRYLLEQHFHLSSCAGPGIIVTGRGYPDLATRLFLQRLTNHVGNSVPIYGLFDADPDGVNIYLCYWMGSRVMAQQAEQGIPQMRWIGIDLDDVENDDCTHLTARDRSKVRHMLARCRAYPNLLPGQKHYAMLQKMLMLNVKAEMQTLENGRGRLVDLLESCLTDVEL